MAKTKPPVKTSKEVSGSIASAQRVTAGVDITSNGATTTIVDNRPSVVIPISPPDGGHCPNRIETRLTRRQGAALKALFCALRENHETCEMEGYGDRGKVIEKEYGHAVRWMLDRVADSWEQETGDKLLEVEGLVF